MPCTSNPGPTAHELDLTWKPFPQGLAFTAPKGTMQASKGGSSQQACLAMVPMDHSNSGMHSVVATNSSRTGLRACWAGGRILPTTLGCWSHGSWKAYSYHFTRTAQSRTTLEYLLPTDKCSSYPYQRNFSWQQMQTITENHIGEQETMVPGPNLYICTQLLHPRLGNYFGRGGQIILKARGTKSLLSDCVS